MKVLMSDTMGETNERSALHGNKPSHGHVIAWWTVVVFWACFIFFMSAHTGNDLNSGSGFIGWVKHQLTSLAEALFGPGTDAVFIAAHFLEYTVFGALLVAALVCSRRYAQMKASKPVEDLSKLIWTTVVLAIVIASLYGVTDEFHQAFVPGRVCDPADWLTDTLGASLGALIAAGILGKMLRIQRS